MFLTTLLFKPCIVGGYYEVTAEAISKDEVIEEFGRYNLNKAFLDEFYRELGDDVPGALNAMFT
jgi:hypothetical protein